MNAKLPDSNWTDTDDAPELVDEWFATATRMIGASEVTDEQFKASIVKRGRPAGSVKEDAKQQTTLRFDPVVLGAFRATGKGWQTRIDLALKDWLKTHRPEELGR